MNQIPYRSVTVGVDPETESLLGAVGAGIPDLPVVLFPDGEPLLHPTQTDLAARVGRHTVHTILNRIGGRIDVDSGPQGTTFTVTLPISP